MIVSSAKIMAPIRASGVVIAVIIPSIVNALSKAMKVT